MEKAVYVLVRRDLKMRRGKEIAQGVHAVARLGYVTGAPLIVLQAPSLEWLTECLHEAFLAGINTAFTQDAGHTEVEPGTVTAAALGPVEKGRLRLVSEAQLY